MVVERNRVGRGKGSELGYRFKKNRRQEVHVRERVKKAMVVMSEVWGIGKRRFGGN